MNELENIIFLDIETVPACREFSEVPEVLRPLWVEFITKKQKYNAAEEEEPKPSAENDYCYANAGLRAEFSRVICVSIGRFAGGTDESNFKIHSLFSDDEVEILKGFSAVLGKYPRHLLCAHYGKGFDFPFLGRRFLINGLKLPSHLDIMGKKPWEVPHLDTNELWGFGAKGMSSGASLKLLCAVFGIPSPKEDIDGSQVRSVYYDDNDLDRIVKYCECDVVSLAKVYKKLRGLA